MGFVSSLGRDLRFAVRQMRQTPIVSGVALLSLALGIGANVAIFSLVNALMLKALPVHEPDRLVLARLRMQPGGANTSFTNPQWEYLRDHQDFFAGADRRPATRGSTSTPAANRDRSPGLFVNGRFFDALGVTPLLGRGFTAEDDRRGGGTDGRWRCSATASGNASSAATPR